VRQRTRRRQLAPRLTLLVGLVLGVVLALAMGMLAGPAARSPQSAESPGTSAITRPGVARAATAPLDHGPANVRHAPPGQPLAETVRAFGSSTLAADSTEGSDRAPYPSRTWTARSGDAVRQVLDAITPRLGRAPPAYRAS